MIARHIPMKAARKSSFSELVKYITNEQGRDERIQGVFITNCQSDLAEIAALEAEAIQALNTRAKGDKTYHLLVSFPADEVPEPEVIQEIESRLVDSLGFSEHQRVSALHHDTDNLHLHVAINKIHPRRRTLHEPYQSYKTLGATCSQLEQEYGLTQTNHIPGRTQSEGRAEDLERHSGIESLISWMRRECANELKEAQSWKRFHEVAHENGLEVRLRGNGIVFQANDGTTVKASSVARELSKARLEGRLGTFESNSIGQGDSQGRSQESQETSTRQYSRVPKASRVDTTQLYARYRESQGAGTSNRGIALKTARRKRDRRMAAAQRHNRMRRAAIRMMRDPRHIKRMLYRQARQSYLADVAETRRLFQRDRQAAMQSFQRQTWADWLQAQARQGSPAALEALRKRQGGGVRRRNTIHSEEGRGGRGNKPPQSEVDTITKRGTVIYRSGADAVRDDGDRLQITRDSSQEGIKTALAMAHERYGSKLRIEGTDEFKEQIAQAAVNSGIEITFSDPALERRRQQLADEEKSDGRRKQAGAERDGRSRQSSGGARQRGVAHGPNSQGGGSPLQNDGRARSRGDEGDGSSDGRALKPNVARPGRKPPPTSTHRLRKLSSLGMVRVSREPSEVLLQGNVPSDLGHQRTAGAEVVRRGVPRAGGVEASADKTLVQQSAADKYIAERNKKKGNHFDILNHRRYNNETGSFIYAGRRRVDGQDLVLLQRGSEIYVRPVDEATALRMKRSKIGETISVTDKGIRRNKGRSR